MLGFIPLSSHTSLVDTPTGVAMKRRANSPARTSPARSSAPAYWPFAALIALLTLMRAPTPASSSCRTEAYYWPGSKESVLSFLTIRR